jgi:release factor glutamine methyltransferase
MTSKRPVDTIGGALSSATRSLRTAGIETARLDAEVLLGHLLNKSRTKLAMDGNDPLDNAVADRLDALVKRRIAGEPVAYLVGSKEFMGYDFAVGPGVLIPRPETELMVERALETMERLWPDRPVRALDACTGSGAVGLSLALASDPGSVRVTLSEISANALAYARRNRSILGLEDLVDVVQGDLLGWTSGPWDLILANPPYLRPDQIDGNPELAAEPRLALDGGRDGLETIERILEQAVPVVAPVFAMLIEIDPDQADAAGALARKHFPAADVIILPDLTGRARFVSIERQESYS